ncbi:MAG: MBL fold metallo-hydrolase [Erythrobacter sp.]|nr:MBL fold metallo-hydrolase [Erythrobacter sp.]
MCRLSDTFAMYRSVIFAAAVSSAIIVSACADEEGGQAEASPRAAAEPGSGTATSILNAGVAARIGSPDAAMKFLFDPLYDNHFGSLEQLDEALIERIVAGDSPYDNVTAVFVSHAHGDHFSARHINRMLAAQPDLRLVAPNQAIERMREVDEWDPTFAVRITAISLDNGEQAESFQIGSARIEAFRSPHSGWPDRHADVHNITFRVSAASGQAMVHCVMHLGDADPGTEFFGPHPEFLSSARTGLAIVPFWFFGEDKAEALVEETLNAEAAVGMHVPAQEPEWLEGSGWQYFNGEGQGAAIAQVPQK